MKNKAEHLLAYVDWDRPGKRPIGRAADPAVVLVEFLARRRYSPFRFEFGRKPEILRFLRRHYAAWRPYDTTAADCLARCSVEQARQPRATAGIAELGKAWWATGNPKYGTAFERFYLRVPTGKMFNWDSFNGSQGAHELDAWFLLLDCPGFATAGRIAFLDHLCAIADFAWDDATSKWGQCSLGH